MRLCVCSGTMGHECFRLWRRGETAELFVEHHTRDRAEAQEDTGCAGPCPTTISRVVHSANGTVMLLKDFFGNQIGDFVIRHVQKRLEHILIMLTEEGSRGTRLGGVL